MVEIICDTSTLQYLHQAGLLHILPQLAQKVVAPPAVVQEIEDGRRTGLDLPDLTKLPWLTIESPTTEEHYSFESNLGPGEFEVLLLGMANRQAIVVIDDRVGRRAAESLGLRIRGTLGLLLDAKRNGLIDNVSDRVDRLQKLGFRLTDRAREEVLRLAGERTEDNDET